MLKKLFTLVTAALLLFMTACTQKYDAFGPGFTEPDQSSTDTTVLISLIAKADYVSNPKVVISESFMYIGTQIDPLNVQDTVLTSWFFTDFTIPARDSLLDSVQFVYPLLVTTTLSDTVNLPTFNISKIYNKWNTIDDSLVKSSKLDTAYFKSTKLKKELIGQFAGKYVLKFTVDTTTFSNWRQSQAQNDSTASRFRGLSFSTTHKQLLKFYSDTYPTSLPFAENYRPRFITWFSKLNDNQIDSVYSVTTALSQSASLVDRKSQYPVINNTTEIDTTLIKIGGVGGEGMLLRFALQDSMPNMPNYLPKNAFILTSRLAMDRVGSDEQNGKLNKLVFYNLTDSNSVWQSNPDSVIANITNKRYDSKNPYYIRFYNITTHPAAYLRETDTILKNWQKYPNKNFGFYLKSAQTISDLDAIQKSESHLGYSQFRNIRFEITYTVPNGGN